MNIFDTALTTILSVPDIGVDAIFTPAGGGSETECRLTFTRGDTDVIGIGPGATLPARIAELRTAVVVTVAEDDAVTIDDDSAPDIDGKTFPILKAEKYDSDRLLWRIELGEPT